MRLINNSSIPEESVWRVAQLAEVKQYNFVVVLDTAVNSVRADYAKQKLTEYRSKGWKPFQSWETDAAGESDFHAYTAHRGMIDNQQLPQHVKDAIVGSDLLVYVDGTWTGSDAINFALTFAHELRHAWQFYNVPIVFFSQTPLSWVMPPQSTPCEVDAEANGKLIAENIFGGATVADHLAAQIATCPPEHRDVWARLKENDKQTRSREMLEAETLHLLKQNAAEIRKLQSMYNFEIPGIRELSMYAEGKLHVSLLP
jgi:hypothetical protein